MRFKSIYISCLFLLMTFRASCQYYDTGQDPANLKWLQVKTDRFSVIYPEIYGSQGIEFARSLEKAYSDLTVLFPDKKFRIPVIIHNYTIQSNGYVSWAPKRMEVYPTPEQNSMPLDPDRQLALHELTHVLQMESLNTGFSKAMTIIFGQQFTGSIASLLPLWYMEGDAVFSESALSESGRGRSPSFQKYLKAIVIEKGHIYKYDKILNGSYREYIPDHYQYGYQMVTWSLAKNDPQLWNKVVKFTANQPFTINPVNISLRREAGLTKKRLYTQTFDSLRTLWGKDISRSNAISYTPINPYKKKDYMNYYSPILAGRDSIIAIKTSFSEPPSFVLINPSEKSEKKLHTPGSIYPYFLSFSGSTLVWVEIHGDPRWENREYSVIKLKNIKSGLTRQLTTRSRYMSASISPDSRMIAASENSLDNKNFLVLINPDDGSVIDKIPSPGNASLQRPQWSADGRNITVIFLTTSGEGISSYEPGSNSWKILVEAGREDLQSSFLKNDSLFYVTSTSGTDNVFLLTPNRKLMSVTNSRFGAIDLNVNGNSVMFCDYTSSGNNICTTSLSDMADVPYSPSRSVSYLIDRFDYSTIKKDEITTTEYTPEPYRKWQHLFDIHSWMPFYADIEAIQSDLTSIRPGLTVMSQNILSTLIVSAGYEYSNDKRHLLHTKLTWKGIYPVLESSFDYGYKPIIASNAGSVTWEPSPLNNAFRFSNYIYIPIKFSTSKFSQNLYPSFKSEFVNRYYYLQDKNIYDYGQNLMTSRFYFSNYFKYAYRDIYPKWAQVFDISYLFAPFDKLIYGKDLSLRTALYFPGIFRDNGIRIRYETEHQEYPVGPYYNSINFPRSYNNIVSGKLNFVSVDYVAPLFYPDINISSILYITRIRSGLFFDYGEGSDNYHLDTKTRTLHTEVFRSFGIELLSDFYLLRIPYNISGGIQAAWKDLYHSPSIELLLNIDIYGMSIGRRRL